MFYAPLCFSKPLLTLACLTATACWVQGLTAPISLPPRQCKPEETEPFVFMHQRKTGGSSIREEIYQSAIKARLPSAIPCLNAPCNGVVERSWHKQVVLAGHFSWGYVFSNIPHQRRPYPRQPQISCLTVFRKPLDRVRSCFYFTLNRSPLRWAELTADQLHQVLTTTNMGQLCTNEPIRIFSGLGSDHLIAGLSSNPALMDVAVKLTIDNLDKCVVLMQEHLDLQVTTDVLAYWFPWLNHTKVMTNATPKDAKPAKETLNPEQMGALRQVLAAEITIYDRAVQLYAAQIKHIRTTPPPPCGTDEAPEPPAPPPGTKDDYTGVYDEAGTDGHEYWETVNPKIPGLV